VRAALDRDGLVGDLPAELVRLFELALGEQQHRGG
jgi:hypothetical protein